jgi:glutaredoxin
VTRVLLALLAVALAVPADAQVYRWTDEQGRVRYSDTPPPPSAKEKKRFGPTAQERARAASKQLAAAAEKFPLTLYSSPTCAAPCAAARAALNKRGVPFREVQVWDDATNAELKRASGGNEVPVLMVGERAAVKGFEQAAFDQALDSAGYPKSGDVPVAEQAAPTAPEGYIPPKERGEAPAATAKPQ